MAAPPALPAIAATALAAQHHGEHDGHGGKTVEHPCAFAAAGASVAMGGDPHPATLQFRRIDSPAPRPLFARPGLGLAAPPAAQDRTTLARLTPPSSRQTKA